VERNVGKLEVSPRFRPVDSEIFPKDFRGQRPISLALVAEQFLPCDALEDFGFVRSPVCYHVIPGSDANIIWQHRLHWAPKAIENDRSAGWRKDKMPTERA